jgi:hypothetical protein
MNNVGGIATDEVFTIIIILYKEKKQRAIIK